MISLGAGARTTRELGPPAESVSVPEKSETKREREMLKLEPLIIPALQPVLLLDKKLQPILGATNRFLELCGQDNFRALSDSQAAELAAVLIAVGELGGNESSGKDGEIFSVTNGINDIRDKMGNSTVYTEMIATIVHDVKNPLAIVSANAQFIHEDYTSNSHEELISALRSADLNALRRDYLEPLRDIKSAWQLAVNALIDDLKYSLTIAINQGGRRAHRDIQNRETRYFMEWIRSSDTASAIVSAITGRAAYFQSRHEDSAKRPNAIPARNYPSVIVQNNVDSAFGFKIEGFDAAVANLAANCLSNACSVDVVAYDTKEIITYGVDARKVVVSIDIEGHDLVIRVSDQGRGLTAEQLDEASQKFIMGLGRSGRKSSGIGLKEPEYYNKNNIRVNIVSKRRDEIGAAHHHFSNDPGEQSGCGQLKKLALASGYSTIFEIRVTITATNNQAISARPKKPISARWESFTDWLHEHPKATEAEAVLMLNKF